MTAYEDELISSTDSVQGVPALVTGQPGIGWLAAHHDDPLLAVLAGRIGALPFPDHQLTSWMPNAKLTASRPTVNSQLQAEPQAGGDAVERVVRHRCSSGLGVFRFESCLFGDTSQHSWPYLFAIMKGEDYI
jgi:hypothetical protein